MITYLTTQIREQFVNVYLQMGMLVVEEEWEREVKGGGGIPVLKEV